MVSEGPLSPHPRPSRRSPGPQTLPPSDPRVQTPSPSLPAESGGRALERELPGTVFLLCDVTQEEDVRVSVFSVPTPGISTLGKSFTSSYKVNYILIL